MCSILPIFAKPFRLAADAADLVDSPETDVSGSNCFARSTLTQLDHHSTKTQKSFLRRKTLPVC